MSALLVIIAGLGLLLLAMLWARLRAVNETLQLKRHRSSEPGVCDLLNYAAVVSDGVVIGKNGALIAGWEYSGQDQASVTDMERDMVSVRLNQALSRLGSGWMVHVDAVRQPVEVYSARAQSHFPDSVTRFRKCLLQGPNELYGVQTSYLFPRRTAPCISLYVDRRNQRFSVRIFRRSTNSEFAWPFAFSLCEQPRFRGPLAFRVGLCLVGVRRSNSKAQNC